MSTSVCPFCALLCDDLPPDACVAPDANTPNCARLRAARTELAAVETPTVRLHGRPADPEDALAHMAARLADARMPLVQLAGADVATARAAVALAERLGAVLDLDRGGRPPVEAVVRARTATVFATLAEVRNRADLVVLFGTDGTGVLPRLSERVLHPPRAIAAAHLAARRIVRIGEGFTPVAGVRDLPCPPDRLHHLAAVLRARIEGHRLPPSPLAAREDLAELAEQLRAARYAAVLWHAGELPAATAEFTVEMLTGLVRHLNRSTRAVALPLAAGLGGTLEKVALWQTGMNVPLDFADGAPDGEPRRFDGRRLAEAGRVDLRLWIGAFPGVRFEPWSVPTLALHHPGLAPQAEVAMPVAVPGVHRDATLFRLDGVVALRARAAAAAPWPTAAALLEALTHRLG